jgi:hypothetical protein
MESSLHGGMVALGLVGVCIASFSSCATVRRSTLLVSMSLLLWFVLLVLEALLLAWMCEILMADESFWQKEATLKWVAMEEGRTSDVITDEELAKATQMYMFNIYSVMCTAAAVTATLLPCILVYYGWRKVLVMKNKGIYDMRSQCEAVRQRNNVKHPALPRGCLQANDKGQKEIHRGIKTNEVDSRQKRIEELMRLVEQAQDEAEDEPVRRQPTVTKTKSQQKPKAVKSQKSPNTMKSQKSPNTVKSQKSPKAVNELEAEKDKDKDKEKEVNPDYQVTRMISLKPAPQGIEHIAALSAAK